MLLLCLVIMAVPRSHKSLDTSLCCIVAVVYDICGTVPHTIFDMLGKTNVKASEFR